MKPDAALLKSILDNVASMGYENDYIDGDALSIDGVERPKLQYHLKHLIKENYLEGRIQDYLGGETDILIERMTDKGALLLDTTTNPDFLEWVKSNTGSAFGDLMKDGVKGGASFGWGLAKQWLMEKFGLVLQ